MFGSFKSVRQPLMLIPDHANLKTLYVRVKPTNLTETIQHLESTWKHYLPDRPFSFKFLDEEIDALYRREQGQSRILSTFSALSVLIGGMGVFGLAAFLVDRRLKEISIRKILGASVSSLLRILMRDHLGLIGIAALVATPLAVYLSRSWLENYATRIDLTPTPFLLSVLLCLGAVIAAVSFHAFRALRVDPVENLRQE
jgi:putative ABC transport system permease protein